MKKRDVLLIFSREPRPSRVKTRLIPYVGADEAARLYETMLLETISLCRSLPSFATRILTTPDSRKSWFKSRVPDVEVRPQEGDSLGPRLTSAFAGAFDEGHERVVAIGTDCPGLGPSHLLETLERLPQVDVLLGPALDGGYYLVGASRFEPRLFEGIDWSTPVVLEQTLARSRELALRFDMMPPLRDIDTLDDLLKAECSASFPKTGKLIRELVESLRASPGENFPS
jgi:rSAM/selenodomain-associated transferase 1